MTEFMTESMLMEMYKVETGATEIEMFSFEEWKMFKMLEEL